MTGRLPIQPFTPDSVGRDRPADEHRCPRCYSRQYGIKSNIACPNEPKSLGITVTNVASENLLAQPEGNRYE